MRKIKMCMFCGEDTKLGGDHTICKDRLAHMAAEMRALPPKEKFLVMRKAELGGYGRAPAKKFIPTNWRPRAKQLRAQGLEWRVVADILNKEGYCSKTGLPLDSSLILKNLNADKKYARE